MTTNITASQLDANTLDSWKGQPALDAEGKKLGKIKDIYLDDKTKKPKWAVVTVTNILTEKVRLAPIAEAVRQDDGIHLPLPKDKIEKSPEVEVTGQLTPTDERKLLYHYGIEFDEAELKAQAAGYHPAPEPPPAEQHPQPQPQPAPPPPAPPTSVATTPPADQSDAQMKVTLQPNQTIEVSTEPKT